MSGPQQKAVVRNGGVSLSVTDWGGPSDPVIVLMPGLGMGQRSLAKVASCLQGWRVITMDLRGHGGSTTGPWTFPYAISDLEAIIAHCRLERPYVGGHSLGGMVALQYAMAGHPVAGVVNIDGWGPGIASRYVGEDRAQVEARLALIATGHLPSRIARVIASLTRQGREGTNRQVLRQLDGADVIAWHAAAPCPSLAFNAVAPAGAVATRALGPEMARVQGSHREGLRRDLAVLAKDRADFSVVEIDAGHQLIATHPEAVASAITAFHENRA